MKPKQPLTDAEQRQEFRLENELTVFIELISGDEHTHSTIVVSKSLDISANGLRVIADRKLAAGSILRTCVQLHNFASKFMLISEVKWARPHNNKGEYLLGLSLFESEGTDIQQWKEFIAITCGSDEPF